MASRIKGITVEIGGDTTGLDKALKSVNSSIKTTQSSLRDVNKLLKIPVFLCIRGFLLHKIKSHCPMSYP